MAKLKWKHLNGIPLILYSVNINLLKLFNCTLNVMFQNDTLAQWCITVREWTPVRVGRWEGPDPTAPVGLTLLPPGPPQ